MTTVILKSKLATITDEVSGGYKDQVTFPLKAKKRNAVLYEAMQLLLEKEKELIVLRKELDNAKADTIRELLTDRGVCQHSPTRKWVDYGDILEFLLELEEEAKDKEQENAK